MTARRRRRLSELHKHEEAVVACVRAEDPHLARYLSILGFTVRSNVRVLERLGRTGAMLVKRGDVAYALSPDVASMIEVWG